MIAETKLHTCPNCSSTNLVKNGTTTKKKQKFKCNDCGRCGTLEPEQKYSAEFKELAVNAYQERVSQRGVSRLLGIARSTLMTWVKKK